MYTTTIFLSHYTYTQLASNNLLLARVHIQLLFKRLLTFKILLHVILMKHKLFLQNHPFIQAYTIRIYTLYLKILQLTELDMQIWLECMYKDQRGL